MSQILCARCKGKGLCGRPDCRIVARIRKMKQVTDKIKTDFFGSSPPSVFVGRIGYPGVFMGVLAPAAQNDTTVYDNPGAWFSSQYSLDKIFDLRSSLINSRVKTDIYKSDSFTQKIQEVALASKPLDIEAKYVSPIRSDVDLYSRMAPTGPAAQIRKLDICDNPRVLGIVDKVVSDTDLGADNAVCLLDRKNMSENQIVKLFSVGLLGEGKRRRLVPTRWSITAADDIISKKHIEDIRTFDEIEMFLVFSGQYLGNHFKILLMPGKWSFECIECTFPGSVWNMDSGKHIIYKDYEKYEGRKSYATNVAGGYYATRLSITRYMQKNKIQASVLSIREVYEDYSMPLGVWLLRETVKDAFSREPEKFDSLDAALLYLGSKLKLDFSFYTAKSDLLKDYRRQKRLTHFMRHR
ncbi:MAG: Nre family DNA repair protein [archaeon]|nr:Nre family DNA repair protein [archaeon]